MAKITTAIPAQAFEVVRDRIAEILIDELENQVAKFYKEELNAKVHIERFIPFDDSELPIVNVGLARGDFDNQTTIDSDGTYRYNIDCYHSAKSTKDVQGDTLANIRLQTLVGACRAILESSQYIRLNFPPPFIMNRQFENIAIAEPPDKKDTISVVMARLTFTVRVPENVDVTSANLIAGFDTQVKLALTEKGYIYSGDNIPVPPVTDGSVTVNGDAFGSVAPGDTINVPVENTYGDLLGSLIGGKWIIANTRFIDSDGSEKFRPAGETIVCIPFITTIDIEFGDLGDSDIERIIGANQASNFTTNVLTNVATVVYEINTVPTTLPFTLDIGDTFKTTITRTTAIVLSRVVLS